MLLFLNVIYVLVAIAMIALILMQRGAGAQAGSGFGAGASGTVFGARGASNFLSKSTKWLAILFFGISLFMAWNATRTSAVVTTVAPEKGMMAEVPSAPAAGTAVPSAPAAVPAAPVTPEQPGVQQTAPGQAVPEQAAPDVAPPAADVAPAASQQPEPAKPATGG